MPLMTHQQVETQKYKNLHEQAGITNVFLLEELNMATNNFSEANKLGSGESGAVYKGVLKDKTEVAIKRVDNTKHGQLQFINEILAIARVKHINLIDLRGYCTDLAPGTGGRFYIVYDFVVHGSLDNWIFKRRGTGQCLPWRLRYKVAVEVAKVLIYLHHDCGEPRLHLDIKPGNILLGDDFRAILSDFGMSKLVKNGNSEDKIVRGTPGYIAHEWYLNHPVSVKFDIFSYGNVLLDLFFGESSVCLDEKGKDIYRGHSEGGNAEWERKIFHDFMLKEIEGGTIRKHMDMRFFERNEEVKEKEVICLVRTALLCIESNPHKRPSDMKEVLEILEHGKSATNVHLPISSTPSQERPLARVPEHFDVFASREITKNEIIRALRDDDTYLVGVYGMGGVGKTTLVKQVREEVEKTKLFDKIAFATISQNPELKLIQNQIAENLGVKVEVETKEARAGRLLEILRQQATILLILDDAWERLKLVDLGIVLSGTCKVIVTSRSSDVCRSMGTARNIKVNVLSREDSLELFRKEVGSVDFEAKREISVELINECEGLPLAIVTLARALREKDKNVWVATVEQLKRSIYQGIDVVTTSIRLSYDFLHKSSKTQQCFLLCALFPEDHEIIMDRLLGYAMGENLLEDGETLREARDNLIIVMDQLISCGLLLKGHNYNQCLKPTVMMHDIIRDTAVSIAHEEINKSLIKAGLGLKRWPKVKSVCLRMSLMSNDICEVPSAPICSLLMTLSLARNPNLKMIPNGFFEKMKCLATLDLSETGISSLPQSISFLNNCLRSLYLDSCSNLRDVSGIGNLKALEILSLTFSGIVRLPEEIRGLKNLKLFDLSGCSSLECIPPNVISSLYSLEELSLPYSQAGSNYSLVELAFLTELRSLVLNSYDPKFLFTNMGKCPWDMLTKFNIEQNSPRSGERSFTLHTSANSFPLADWVVILVGRTYHLRLEGECVDIKNILQINPNGFCSLRYLYIECWDTIEFIVDTNEQIPETVFVQLETLVLRHLTRLKAIWNGPFLEVSLKKLSSLEINGCDSLVCILPTSSADGGAINIVSNNLIALPQPPIFSNLTYLSINDCPKLKCLFSIRVLRGLVQLKSLFLYECPNMEGIAEENQLEEVGEVSNKKVCLPLLIVLHLISLHSLSSFFSQQRSSWLPHVLYCPSLEEFEISDCSNLKRLPFGLENVPKLPGESCCNLVNIVHETFEERIQQVEVFHALGCNSNSNPGSSLNGRAINLVSRNLKVLPQPPIFSNLIRLDIDNCNDLKFIFSFEILRGLVRLEHLRLVSCNDMEGIAEECEVEEMAVDGNNKLCLSSLIDLGLETLPRFSSFFSQKKNSQLSHVLLDCPSLESIYISECPNLKSLPFGVQNIPKLQTFNTTDCEWFKSLQCDPSVKSQLLLASNLSI